MPSKKPRVVKRLLIATAVVVVALLLGDLSFRAYDSHLRFAGLKNLQSIQIALAEYGQQVRVGNDWRVDLVRIGAVDEDQLRDPRSGEPNTYVNNLNLPDGTDWSTIPTAYTPLSDSPFSWWFAAYGHATRGGGVLYGDGHAMWHAEQNYRQILAAVENRG